VKYLLARQKMTAALIVAVRAVAIRAVAACVTGLALCAPAARAAQGEEWGKSGGTFTPKLLPIQVQSVP
jgi:hypothetical protein